MADSTLIQTGQRLYDQQAQQGFGNSDAFQKGKALITDQIDKNLKFEQDQKKNEFELERLEYESTKREMSLDKAITMQQAEKAEYFDLIEQANAKGLISDEAYNLAPEKRENWYKDQTTALKHGTDKASLTRRLGQAMKGEQNWGKVLELASNSDISMSSTEAYRMDMAIDVYAKKSGGAPPPIITGEDGKDYFEIPDPEGGEPILIPVDGVANNPGGVFGQFDPKVNFEKVQANFAAKQPALFGRFKEGKATKADLNATQIWFEDQLANSTQVLELADSMLIDVGDKLNHADLGITDLDKDGRVSGRDFDINGDGEIDDQEKAAMKGLYTEILKAEFGEQEFEKNNEGTFTKPQVQTYNAFKEIYGGNVNALQSLPGVHSYQIKDGQAYLFLGDKREEENVFVVPMEGGKITKPGMDLLARKFQFVNIKPQGDGVKDGPGTPNNPIQGTQENTQGESVIAEGQNITKDSKEEAVALNNSNFTVDSVKGSGVQQRHINKVVNALAGVEISYGNLDNIRSIVAKNVTGKTERDAIMKHIRSLLVQ